jgi:hypothetical protein
MRRFHDADAGNSYGDMGSFFHTTHMYLIVLEQEALELLELWRVLFIFKDKKYIVYN